MTTHAYIFQTPKSKKPRKNNISLPVQACSDEWLQHAQEVNMRIMKKYAKREK